MSRFITLLVALTVASSVFAQNVAQQTAPHKAKSHKAVPVAAEKPVDPSDVSEVPRNVQKWIGGAVDDILTGADKATNPRGEKR